jgi:hypothetical protein
MARPRKQVDVLAVLGLRLSGASWREISAQTGLGLGTVFRAHRTALDTLAAFQNRRTRHALQPTQPQPGASGQISSQAA